MMPDTLARTLATPNAYMQPPAYRRFVESEKNSAYFRNTLLSLVEVYAKHGLSLDYDISASEEPVGAGKVPVKDMTCLSLIRKDVR